MILYSTDFLQKSLQSEHVLIGILLLGVILVLATVLALVVQSKRAGLSHIPGPWLAKYTDVWGVYAAYKAFSSKDKILYHRQMQARYGNVVRTGPKTVTVLDPAAVPTIYGVRSRLNKGDAYIPFRHPKAPIAMMTMQEESEHAQHRRLVANAYSMTSLKAYEPYVEELVDRFIEVCGNHAETGHSLNLSLWCHYYAFDLICKLTLGQTRGFMNGDGQDVFGFIRFIKQYLTYVVYVSHMPWLHRVLKDNEVMRPRKPTPFHGVTGSAIATRLQNHEPKNSSRPDMLSHFIATNEKNPDQMTKTEVWVAATSSLAAGGLSTSIAFDELWRYLSTHPESQDKLYEELVAANVMMPAAPYDDVKGLPYLEGVIREAYRLHVGASFDLQRVTSPAGLDLPDGQHIPAGINIGSPPGMMNRDKSIFGLDADTYRPERWLRGADETMEAFDLRRNLMDRTELTFGHGTRSCIGKNIVALEFFKAVAPLIYYFKFEVVNEAKESDVLVRIHRREKR